jgi:hypothetical protein
VPRGKYWTPEEDKKLIEVMNMFYEKEGYKQKDLVPILESEIKKVAGRNANGINLINRYHWLTKKKGTKALPSDAPKYILVIHTNEDKASGQMHVCYSREEVGGKLTEHTNRHGGVVPMHTVFGKVSFRVVLEDIVEN